MISISFNNLYEVARQLTINSDLEIYVAFCYSSTAKKSAFVLIHFFKQKSRMTL